jgi:hypothetical protein
MIWHTADYTDGGCTGCVEGCEWCCEPDPERVPEPVEDEPTEPSIPVAAHVDCDEQLLARAEARRRVRAGALSAEGGGLLVVREVRP